LGAAFNTKALFRRKFPPPRYYPQVHNPWEDGDEHVDVEAIRAHPRKLSDAELIREGQAARQLVSGTNRLPRKVFVVGVEECRAESRRRQVPFDAV
jgi:hypothetical protein